MDDDFVQVTCRACDGEGCSYCDSRGRVEVRAPAAPCPHCVGECCIYCGYTGWAGLRPKYDGVEAARAHRCDKPGCCD